MVYFSSMQRGDDQQRDHRKKISRPTFQLLKAVSSKNANAAPGSRRVMMRKNPGMTVMLSCRESRCAIVPLVARSES